MTEPTTPTADPAAPEATEQQSETPPSVDALPPWARESLTKANQEAAKYRTQVAELKPLADQFRQLEEASKSELQRLQESYEAAARERESAQAETLRLRVALKHGISNDDFELLGSGTEEQIEARATRIAEKNKAVADAMSALNTAPPGAPLSRRPGEQLKPGATPAAPPQLVEQDYPAEWLSPTQRARVQQERERFQ